MIQEKVNQLLGIGALVSRGALSDVKENAEIETARTEYVAKLNKQGAANFEGQIDSQGPIRNNIISQQREVNRQRRLQRGIRKEQLRIESEIPDEDPDGMPDDVRAEIESQEEAGRMRGIQSMQSKGQSSFNQKSEVRSILDDLRSKKQISHSTYEQMKEALKHNG